MSTHHHEHGGPAEGWQNEGSGATERSVERTENHPGDLYRSRGASSGDTGRFRPEQTEADRFWSKVDRSAPQGCWLWLGQRNAWGYGHFRRTLAPGVHRTVKAHRYAYVLVVGPIPPGLTLDHLCGHPACVRPEHLEPVTAAENLRRRHARARSTEGNQP